MFLLGMLNLLFLNSVNIQYSIIFMFKLEKNLTDPTLLLNCQKNMHGVHVPPLLITLTLGA